VSVSVCVCVCVCVCLCVCVCDLSCSCYARAQHHADTHTTHRTPTHTEHTHSTSRSQKHDTHTHAHHTPNTTHQHAQRTLTLRPGHKNMTPAEEAEDAESRARNSKMCYLDDLYKKSSKIPDSNYELPIRPNKNPVKLTVANFDPASYAITPVRFEVFLEILAAKGLRWTTYKNDSFCPLCSNGPVEIELLKILDVKCAELLVATDVATPRSMHLATENKEYSILNTRRQKLMDTIKDYNLHVEQMKTARKHAYAKRDNMKVGDVFVTRDFVNHHDHSGGHVKCLILVLEWYEQEGGELQVLKVRNYCSDKETMTTNFGYMLDVWRYQLHKKDASHPGFFDDFDTIYVGGDHGGHFAHTATMIEESKFWSKYGKEIRPVFFPSYHAHGRADAAGAEDKK
jgi:hypothetical protein